EIRRVDHGEHLAGLHMRADVKLPTLQIAADPRVDRRLAVGLDGSGQSQALELVSLFELGERNSRNSLLVRPLDEISIGVGPVDNAACRDAAGNNQRDDTD